jgi:hypothetical protein
MAKQRVFRDPNEKSLTQGQAFLFLGTIDRGTLRHLTASTMLAYTASTRTTAPQKMVTRTSGHARSTVLAACALTMPLDS